VTCAPFWRPLRAGNACPASSTSALVHGMVSRPFGGWAEQGCWRKLDQAAIQPPAVRSGGWESAGLKAGWAGRPNPDFLRAALPWGRSHVQQYLALVPLAIEQLDLLVPHLVDQQQPSGWQRGYLTAPDSCMSAHDTHAGRLRLGPDATRLPGGVRRSRRGPAWSLGAAGQLHQLPSGM